jgi:hypothetical protein
MQHRMRPHYLSGDVCTLFSVAADAFLHMTNDEHDVGAYWKELNCWHTFVLSPSGPQGIISCCPTLACLDVLSDLYNSKRH